MRLYSRSLRERRGIEAEWLNQKVERAVGFLSRACAQVHLIGAHAYFPFTRARISCARKCTTAALRYYRALPLVLDLIESRSRNRCARGQGERLDAIIKVVLAVQSGRA